MPSQTAKKLAKRIKELREKRGFTQEEAARRCHIEYKYYQRYEGNTPRDMRLSTMERIAKGFDIELPELLNFD
jgi:transcriptional regulator with XRE-family HTH domain